jgi:hypothetical protein
MMMMMMMICGRLMQRRIRLASSVFYDFEKDLH